jgi:hypothetical protein
VAKDGRVSITSAVPRLIARFGRPATLRRRQAMTTTFTEIAVTGWLRSFSPEEITGGVMNGDAEMTINAAPVLASAGFAPPVKGDFVAIDGKNWAVLGCNPLMVASTAVAYALHVRGG